MEWDGITERRSRKQQCHKMICGLSDDDMDNFMDDIAERGAKRALKKIGLEDDDAIADMKSLRGILKNWRKGISVSVEYVGRLILYGIVIVLASMLFKPGAQIVQAIKNINP